MFDNKLYYRDKKHFVNEAFLGLSGQKLKLLMFVGPHSKH